MRTVVIDDVAYTVVFQGVDKALQIKVTNGEVVTLLPWLLRDFIPVLAVCLIHSMDGLQLNRTQYAQAVLRHSSVSKLYWQELALLALWWGCGANSDMNITELDNGQLRLGRYLFELRGWSGHQRMTALSVCTLEQQDNMHLDGEFSFDLVQYLRLMVQSSVISACQSESKQPIDIDVLDCATALALINRVISLNVVGSLDSEIKLWSVGASTRQVAQKTLTLCKVLGWGPTQLWALPAAEIDRLYAMTQLLQEDRSQLIQSQIYSNRASPPAVNASHSSRFTSDPDSTFIQIKSDE